MNGLQLKGAEEEVEPVHGETGTLRNKHRRAREINTYPIAAAIFEMLQLLSPCLRRGHLVR